MQWVLGRLLFYVFRIVWRNGDKQISVSSFKVYPSLIVKGRGNIILACLFRHRGKRTMQQPRLPSLITVHVAMILHSSGERNTCRYEITSSKQGNKD